MTRKIFHGLDSGSFLHFNEVAIGELNNDNFDEYGEWLYHLTVLGRQSASEPWGWQFDGHHAIINYFVLGDQVVMTPAFWGSEPPIPSRSGVAARRPTAATSLSIGSKIPRQS